VGTPSRRRLSRLSLPARCRNINRPSVGYACRPRLRLRLTLGGLTFPRNPQVFGDRDSHPVDRYSSRHSHSRPLQGSSPSPFAAAATLSYHALARIRRFGTPLSPGHYRRRAPRPVSYYALFKWWLLLSQHPGCRGGPTSFGTQRRFGALAGGLGCSPLDDGAYPPPSSCPAVPTGIRSLVRAGSRVGPRPDSVALPPVLNAER
jgi:hypothetical protein